MRKLLLATLMAANMVPATGASAQNRELRRDRQDVREEQRELRGDRRDLHRAVRSGDRDDIRDERRDVRDGRRDVRDARQDYREDWQDHRRSHRGLYRAQRFDAPFRYVSFAPGVRIAADYQAPRYRVHQWNRWQLPDPGGDRAYVRHYNDLLLINTRSGRVVRVYRGFFW